MNLEQILVKTGEAVRLRGFSSKTLEAYSACLKRYFGEYRGNPGWIDVELIRGMLLDMQKRDFAPKTIDLHLNAVKFFYREVARNPFPIKIRCSKRVRRLPVVLTKEEVQRVLGAIGNVKHRLMVALAYSAGLRVSEVVKLKVADVELEARVLNIREAKGQKDRITLVAERLVPDLEKLVYRRQGGEWLFESMRGGKLSARSLQAVFAQALGRSGVQKDATFHSLRHSFATHVIEGGTDVLHLQKILGHSNIRTTQIYTHVARASIAQVKSPLDS